MTKKVVIVQPYVPTYRVTFFEELIETLAGSGVDCEVAAGMPTGDQAARGDSVSASWITPVVWKSIAVQGRSIDVGINPIPWKNSNAVILGLEGSSLPVYMAFLESLRTSMKVGLWGHVKPYVAPGNPIDLWLEKQLIKAADHIFAYTEGGRQYALNFGVTPHKLTTVMNTVDTSALEKAKSELTSGRLQEFIRECNVDPSRTICFIGGFDESKRIAFLVEALDFLWTRDSSVRLIVGGDGPDKGMLNASIARGQVLDLGYLTTEAKAAVMTISRAVVMPGRIGLVAVDALVMKCPIVTTEWAYHAPEKDYLIEGESCITSANHPEQFANAVIETLSRSQASAEWNYPRMDVMVQNFAAGVVSMLE